MPEIPLLAPLRERKAGDSRPQCIEINDKLFGRTLTESVANKDYPNFHKYGCLWVPQSLNGGTGIIRRFFDGVELSGCSPLTYSATGGTWPHGSIPAGLYQNLDSQQMMICLEAGYQQPVLWDYVMVWQASASNRLVNGP
jgi:hypothetical protein